jgi:hypothetical protein
VVNLVERESLFVGFEELILYNTILESFENLDGYENVQLVGNTLSNQTIFRTGRCGNHGGNEPMNNVKSYYKCKILAQSVH